MTPLIIATALSVLALDPSPATSKVVIVAPATVPAPAPAPDLARKKEAAQTSDYYNKADICTDRPITGSRITRRICITRAVKAEQDRRLLMFENRLGETVGYKPLDSNSPIPAN